MYGHLRPCLFMTGHAPGSPVETYGISHTVLSSSSSSSSRACREDTRRTMQVHSAGGRLGSQRALVEGCGWVTTTHFRRLRSPKAFATGPSKEPLLTESALPF